MDVIKKAALERHLRSLGAADVPVAVPVELFFDGNDDDGSIAPSYGLDFDALQAALMRLRDHPRVADVFVELDDPGEPDDDAEGDWPYATGVGVYTSLPAAEIATLLSDIEVEATAYPAGAAFTGAGAPPLPAGLTYVGVWWD